MIDALVQRKDSLVLGVLILITVAVRLPGVYNRAIWYDESITLLETAGNAIPQWSQSPTPAATQKRLLAGSAPLHDIAAGLRKTDVHPPMYYGLLSLWRRAAGDSLETARLFSVFWSTASVVLFYLLLRLSSCQWPVIPSLVYSLSSGAVHYAHEARNYSLTLFFLLMASYFAYLSIYSMKDNRYSSLMFSFLMSLFCGLAFLTHYLSIFSVFFLLFWYVFWFPKTERARAIPAIVITLGISLIGFHTLAAQLGARPKQFQRELGLVQELWKIIKFNFEMIWTPIFSSTGLEVAAIATVSVLALAGIFCVKNSWDMIDRKLFSMMAGLAVVPSAGVLILDVVFSKSLGKSSYVFLAGPPVVYFLTLAINGLAGRETTGSPSPTAGFGHAVSVVIAFFVGLQLTGINFDLERTPGFAGSTLRSLAGRIESSSSSPVVVIGAGHGRGDPATLIYELQPDTLVCVLDRDSDISALIAELTNFDEIWIVFAKGRMTAAVETSLFEALSSTGSYRVTSRTVRFVHLTRKSRTAKLG